VLTLSPTSSLIPVLGTVEITVESSAPITSAIAWFVDAIPGGDKTVGTIAGAGTAVSYTAPVTEGSHTVTAASVTDASVAASILVTVQSSTPALAMAMTPSAATTIDGSGSGLFTATVTTGSSNTAVTWTVDGVVGGNATVGTIKTGVAMGGMNNHGNQVLYLAPAAAGSHVIKATSVASPSVSASAPVFVSDAAYTVINSASIFNVTRYGAVADGASNNAAAFASAIAAASAQGGGVVLVPAAAQPYGIACSNTGFGYYGVLLPANVTLQINAGATVQALAGAPATCSLIAVDGSNINLVGGGVLDGNAAQNAGKSLPLVFLGLGSNITVANLTLQNSPQDGIFVEQSLGGNLSGVQIYGVSTTGTARDGLTIDSGSGIVIRDCTFSKAQACGIDIEPNSGQGPTEVSIFNSVISNARNCGIQSGPDDAGDTGTFTHSVFAFNTITEVNVGIYQANSNGIAIHNNTISDTVDGNYPACGIMLNDSSTALGVANDLVLGNRVASSAGNGIYAVNCLDTVIGYNTITNCAGYGIDIPDASATVQGGTNIGSGNASGNTNGVGF
jgi:polygalacturonase